MKIHVLRRGPGNYAAMLVKGKWKGPVGLGTSRLLALSRLLRDNPGVFGVGVITGLEEFQRTPPDCVHDEVPPPLAPINLWAPRPPEFNNYSSW